jgi:acyl-CoA dehydrogenase
MADTPLASAPFPQAVRVPYARHARFALLWQAQGSGTALFLIGPGAHPLAPGENPAGEPRDRITLGEVPQTIAGHLEWPAEQVRAWGALLRSAQMVGAMQHVLDVAVEHANTRVQFGRTIGSFQALQHRLVVAYGQCATAAAAVDAAAGLSGCGPHPLAVPAAKIRAGAAAATVARTAHQVLGAMGYTREHSLHLFTRRLWSWRDDFGSEAYWARRLGAEARRRSSLPDGLWAWITADETA